MAEFDRDNLPTAAEAAYRDALLGDDTGREQRRARLMAALPRSATPEPVAVGRHALAWRASPYAWGALAIGVLIAAVMVLRGQGGEPAATPDPRLAAAAPASTATVVAQADPVAEPRAPAAAPVPAPRVAAKVAAPPRAERPAPVVVADAGAPQRPAQPETPAAAETAAAAPPPPAAPTVAVAAAPAPRVMAEASNAEGSVPRVETAPSALAARAKAAPRVGLAPASAPPVAGMAERADMAPAVSAANALLLAAVPQGDLSAARAALQAGASVHVRDTQGRTVLMLAARAGARDLAALLLSAGARKGDRDAQGWTAADHARDQGHDALSDALR